MDTPQQYSFFSDLNIHGTFLFQLFMIDNCADDWRIAMTWQRMMQIGEREQYTIFYTGCHAFHDYKLRTQLP